LFGGGACRSQSAGVAFGIDHVPATVQNTRMGISILGVLIITLVLFVAVAILARLTLGD
jgi:hypothetical protein